MSVKTTLRGKLDELVLHMRNEVGVKDMRVAVLLTDPEVKDYITKQEIGCFLLGCGPKCFNFHSPLHNAAYLGKLEFIQEFLECGAKVDCLSVNGRSRLTALHCAVHKKEWKVVSLLRKSGANSNMRGTSYLWKFQDKSPLELAFGSIQEDVRVVEELQKNLVEGAAIASGPLRIAKLEADTKFIANLRAKRDQIDCFSDFEIICKSRGGDETIFRCHKFVLYTCSSVFYQMLRNEDSEHSRTGKIIITDIPVHVMNKFLDFLYQDGLEDVDLDDVEELLKVGKRYRVDGLKTACEKELINMMTTSNCVFMLHLSKKFGGDELEVRALDMVRSNLYTASKSKDFFLLMQDFPDALYDGKQ